MEISKWLSRHHTIHGDIIQLLAKKTQPHTVYTVYLADSKFGELEHKFKLMNIQFGEQDDINVNCLTNTHNTIIADVH